MRNQNVAALVALVSASQQYYQRWPIPCEIYSITGAQIYPSLYYAFPYTSHVAKISQLHSSYNPIDSVLYRRIKIRQPEVKRLPTTTIGVCENLNHSAFYHPNRERPAALRRPLPNWTLADYFTGTGVPAILIGTLPTVFRLVK